MSNPSEEDWKRMSKLVDSIFQRPDAGTLRRIVEYRDVTLRYSIMLWIPLSYRVKSSSSFSHRHLLIVSLDHPTEPFREAVGWKELGTSDAKR
jgi:hypothetical protein